MQVQTVADYDCHTGENPLWHPREKRLYWSDIPTGRLFRYDPATGRHEQIYTGRPVGGFTFQDDGSLLLFRDGGNVVAWREGVEGARIVDRVAGMEGFRYNDVIADPEGRVYCGVMSENYQPGGLYRLDRDGRLTQILDDIPCSNGMGFTPDGQHLYYTDTTRCTIWLFDYDRATGQLTHQRPWLKTPEDWGWPDGMTVDTEGCIWSAFWNGGCVRRFAPDGSQLQRLDLPAPRITSVAFGGENLKDLYITSAGGNSREEDGPQGGMVFRVRPAVGGVNEFFSRIGI